MTGTVSQAGTRIFIAGVASKIDTAALIDAAVQQKTLRADRLDIQIDSNTAKITAYAELETLTENLEASLDQLKGNPGFFDDNETVFDQLSGTITTSDGSDFSSIVGVSINDDAAIGSYEIEVIQSAETQKVAGSPLVDKTLALGHTGSFELGLLSRVNVQIDVTAGMSLEDIATAINAVKDTTGVEASIIKVTETEYTLILTGLDTASNMVNFQVAGDDVLNLIGIGDGFGGFQNTLQVAQEAIIEIDGVEIRRNDNLFDDVLTGIELDIKGSAPGTIISLDVENDASSVKGAILDFIDTYNALRDFVVKHQQISAAGVSPDAVLFSDNILDGLASTLTSVLAENFNASPALQTIYDLGITITNQNKLTVSDEDRLDSVILNNFSELKSAFGASTTTSDPELQLLSSVSVGKNLSFVFDIQTDGAGTVTSVGIGGDTNLFDITGTSFEGKAGTAYAGLVFSYQGVSLSASVNFDFSQGLSDRLLNSIDTFTNSVTGLIIREKAILQDENKNLGNDAQEIRDRAENYRLDQINKYAKFEARLAALEILRAQIRAILGLGDDDN